MTKERENSREIRSLSNSYSTPGRGTRCGPLCFHRPAGHPLASGAERSAEPRFDDLVGRLAHEAEVFKTRQITALEGVLRACHAGVDVTREKLKLLLEDNDGSKLPVIANAAEKRGPDGRRIGRFQHVVTDPSMRRRGLCGTLVEHASRHAFAHLDADVLRIAADENDTARRVYEACGYRIVSRHRGVERDR